MLTIRPASLNDISDIMAYSRGAHERSRNYRELGFNSVIWRRSIKDALRDPDMVVLVAKRGAGVCGLLVGMRAPAPWFAGYCATDIVFSAQAGGDVLLDAFVIWCRSKRVTRIDMGVSEDVTPEEMAAYDRLFKAAGFSTAGRVYYRMMEKVA